jgi:hypothetical protein
VARGGRLVKWILIFEQKVAKGARREEPRLSEGPRRLVEWRLGAGAGEQVGTGTLVIGPGRGDDDGMGGDGAEGADAGGIPRCLGIVLIVLAILGDGEAEVAGGGAGHGVGDELVKEGASGARSLSILNHATPWMIPQWPLAMQTRTRIDAALPSGRSMGGMVARGGGEVNGILRIEQKVAKGAKE